MGPQNILGNYLGPYIALSSTILYHTKTCPKRMLLIQLLYKQSHRVIEEAASQGLANASLRSAHMGPPEVPEALYDVLTGGLLNEAPFDFTVQGPPRSSSPGRNKSNLFVTTIQEPRTFRALSILSKIPNNCQTHPMRVAARSLRPPRFLRRSRALA